MLIFNVLTASLLAVVSAKKCPGYIANNVTHGSNFLSATLSLAGKGCNRYGKDIASLQLLVEYQTNSRLHVKIFDTDEKVYQIPPQYLSLPSGASTSYGSLLNFTYVKDPFSFAVIRTATGETLFNTSGSQIIFESQYIRLRTSLPKDPNLYGLGQDSDSMRRPTKRYMRTLWNIGQPFLRHEVNQYGSHPVYYEMRNGTAHGVYLANSNGMDIRIDHTASRGQYLEYTAVGGVFDFYFLAGPTPSEVSQQYAGVVGTPAEQAYWTYGFHQCKYGWTNIQMLEEVVQNYSKANIPLETLWSDIDYMDRWRTFTLDPHRYPLKRVQELVSYLHHNNQSFVMMVDPAMAVNEKRSYSKGLKDDVFFKKADGSVYVGGMWPGPTSWVDWLHPNASKFWSGQINSFFNDKTGVGVDGIWIDMNEPANFCSYPCPNPAAFRWTYDNSTNQVTVQKSPPDQIAQTAQTAQTAEIGSLSSQRILARNEHSSPRSGMHGRNLMQPPYRIHNADGDLYGGTLDSDLLHSGGYAFYDTHNYFANGMQIHTRNALETRRPGKRPFIISRSTAPGAGNKTGVWTGDNGSEWSQYLISIKQNIEFATFYQIPMVGADVCGFNIDTYESLCQRWTVLGAWYPFYRNHADIKAMRQEFYLWPSVSAAARAAIKTRMQLLDYFYTAFHYQSLDGIPRTILPLFYVYPADTQTLEIETQFFYGESLLVSPVTVEYSSSVTFYLPNDTFYDFFTGEAVRGNGTFTTAHNVNYTEIVVHMRGGSIIPLRIDGANTTRALRDLDFDLLIAPDAHGQAVGKLYLDDGESIHPASTSEIEFRYNSTSGVLAASGTFAYETNVKLRYANILGVEDKGDDKSGGEKNKKKKKHGLQGKVGGRKGLVVKVGKGLRKAFDMKLTNGAGDGGGGGGGGGGGDHDGDLAIKPDLR